MEKELNPDVIKATQSALGKYVKRPPLSEKLLRKPPFRFLHDIVTTVMKTTGFFEGLFEEDELISDNVKDRDSKILFLNKVISVLSTTTGKNLAVKPSKIVAGQEPENTNELLQCIAFALDNKLTSKEAVAQYKDGSKSKSDKTDKNKDLAKNVKKPSEQKKLTSRSSEKLTSTKKESSEKTSLTNRSDKEKANTAKSKQKETVPSKKESLHKKTATQPSKTLTKKNSVDKPTNNQNETVSSKKINNSVDISATHNEDKLSEGIKHDKLNKDSDVDPDVLDKQDIAPAVVLTQQLSPRESKGQDEKEELNTSYTIAENDLNSSLSSQDLMEVKSEENQLIFNEDSEKQSEHPISLVRQDSNKYLHEDSKSFNRSNDSRPSSRTKDTETTSNTITYSSPKKSKEDSHHVLRPKSVRPSSSRPGAPRLRDKHDTIVSANENLIVGKVNIIVENTPIEEEEDPSIIIVDQQDAPSVSNEPELQLSSHQQHGALVQQILDSQKEYSQTAGKTEIEWQFGAQKAREAVNQEIEQLRFNIQALSRVANPLGKVLDHIQEDVEVMRQELQQWTQTYEEASKELAKQKTANEDSLFPLHTKLKQLDVDIAEKRDKINDLKIIIHKNSSRIEKLLASGDVQ